MFIPFVIPTSVRTRKKWVNDVSNTPFFGGYLIIFIALLPPFFAGWILGEILFSFMRLSQAHWNLILFLFGLGLFFWDRWLRSTYETEIEIVYIPIEYLSYIGIVFAIFFVYAK